MLLLQEGAAADSFDRMAQWDWKSNCAQGPLLLTWINFNIHMDK